MTDTSEVLLKFFDEDWRQVRQSENQRTAFSNIVLVIASAVLGFLTQYGLSRNTLPLAALLIVLGLFGGIASMKLYERSRLHMELAWAWRGRLQELHPDMDLDRLLGEVEEVHRKRFKRLFGIRLHNVWLALDLGIAAAGIVLSLIAMSRQ